MEHIPLSSIISAFGSEIYFLSSLLAADFVLMVLFLKPSFLLILVIFKHYILLT